MGEKESKLRKHFEYLKTDAETLAACDGHAQIVWDSEVVGWNDNEPFIHQNGKCCYCGLTFIINTAALGADGTGINEHCNCTKKQEQIANIVNVCYHEEDEPVLPNVKKTILRKSLENFDPEALEILAELCRTLESR